MIGLSFFFRNFQKFQITGNQLVGKSKVVFGSQKNDIYVNIRSPISELILMRNYLQMTNLFVVVYDENMGAYQLHNDLKVIPE